MFSVNVGNLLNIFMEQNKNPNMCVCVCLCLSLCVCGRVCVFFLCVYKIRENIKGTFHLIILQTLCERFMFMFSEHSETSIKI